jgi:predicted transcriptional regulator
MSDAGRKYKDYKIYSCFVLNKLVSALSIDIYQEELEQKLDDILKSAPQELTKADIRHEIRSNHNMTEKILEELIAEELIEILKLERKYCVRITKKGVLHIRKFNEFYAQIYESQIRDHYKYQELPAWFLKHKA